MREQRDDKADPDRKSSSGTGSCLCGNVHYEVTGTLRDIVCCHCTECRKHTGHFMAATATRLSNLHLLRSDGLKWYRSSDTARRAFCNNCGSTLFWRRDGVDHIAIAAGTLNDRTGLKIVCHVFCAEAGDYYEIPVGVLSFEMNGDDAVVAVR